MFKRLTRSWQLVKASAAVLKQDRKLMVFPLISAVAMFAVLASFAFPIFGWMFFHDEAKIGSTWGDGEVYGVAFLFYLTQYFVIFFFNAALVDAALVRLNGGTPRVRESLRVACTKWTRILGYAAIAATIGVLINAIQERVGFVGRIIAGVLGAGWSIATFLVVPVLVAEEVGPVEAVKKSAKALKRTWGENLVGQASMGFAFTLIQMVIIVLGALMVIGSIAAGSPALTILSLVVSIGAVLTALLVHGALSGIYAAALYRFATQNGNASGFDSEILNKAFVAKA